MEKNTARPYPKGRRQMLPAEVQHRIGSLKDPFHLKSIIWRYSPQSGSAISVSRPPNNTLQHLPFLFFQRCVMSPAAQEPHQLCMRTQLPSNYHCLQKGLNLSFKFSIHPLKTSPFIHNWFPQHQLKSQALRTL